MRNKEVTLHLLNTLLIGEDTGLITDITFIESEMVGFLPGKRNTFLFTITTADGEADASNASASALGMHIM